MCGGYSNQQIIGYTQFPQISLKDTNIIFKNFIYKNRRILLQFLNKK
jgi:hypothetical protein